MIRLQIARPLAKGLLSFCLLLSAFGLSLALAQNPVFLAMDSAPAGFEDLAAPQRSLVDIYYGNRYLTSQIATFSPQMIRLSDPAMVVRLIDNITDPSRVEDALSGELQTHAGDVCPTRQSRNCGLLYPAVAGVIFDEDRFRVDVFVNRQLLLTRDAEVRKYLPPSDAGLSLLQNVSGAWSGSDAPGGQRDDYTINGLSQFAYRENSVYFNWNYTRNLEFQVNDLYGRRNFEGVEYHAGLMGSSAFGLSFTPDRTLLGARVASSDDTRTDTEYSGGMPLDVFLPTRGRVEIRRDDRLLTSYFLEAGSQQLDTTSFPPGAYDVEIRILNEDGVIISQETRFFAKRFRLPPKGEWQYFAETGRVLDRNSGDTWPASTEQWLTRAGVSRRLSDTLAGTAAMAMTHDDTLMELGIFNIGYLYEFLPSVMLATNGDYGLNLTTWLRYQQVSGNVSYRRLWKNGDAATAPTGNADHPPLLGNGFEQKSVSISFPLSVGTMNYRCNSNRQGNGNTARVHSLDYRATMFRTPDYDISMTLGFSHSGNTDIVLASVEFRLRDDHWTWRVSPRTQYNDISGHHDRTENLRISANWADRNLFDSMIRVGAGAETGSDNDRYDAHLQVGNSWGRGELNLNHIRGVSDKTDSVTSYSASFSTSFLTDGTHHTLGGERPAESAVVVNVNGNEGDVFDVNIDGQRRSHAVAGRPSVIPLLPYRQYRISVHSGASTLYDLDERERTITLYPGNVVSMSYDAVALKLLFGRLMLGGEPVIDARISGGLYPARSSDQGLFQLESRVDNDNIHVELDNGWLCHVPVPVSDSGYVQQMGSIDLSSADCAPLTEGSLASNQK